MGAVRKLDHAKEERIKLRKKLDRMVRWTARVERKIDSIEDRLRREGYLHA